MSFSAGGPSGQRYYSPPTASASQPPQQHLREKFDFHPHAASREPNRHHRVMSAGSQITAGTQGSGPEPLHPIDSNGLEPAAKGSPQRTGCEPQHRLPEHIRDFASSPDCGKWCRGVVAAALSPHRPCPVRGLAKACYIRVARHYANLSNRTAADSLLRAALHHAGTNRSFNCGRS